MKEPKSLKSLKNLGELSRKIYINDSAKNTSFKYPNNGILTSKYTILTFLPKSLYIQFLRVANIYFLITAIVSSIGEVSPTGPTTSIVPLAFVLCTSILREAFEDWKRYKNDKLINNQSTTVLLKKHKGSQPDFSKTKWKKIVVGDIVRVQNNEEIPADMILLASSDENGLAYVETASLDGERNLKLKQSRFEIKEMVRRSGVESLKGALLVETPNQRIHQFKGIIEIEDLEPIYLNYSNLLLRGTHLKNTDYAIGLVVYTGHDTKLLKNQGLFRNKRSSIERQLNKYIVLIFIAQLALCLLVSILSGFFNEEYFDTPNGPRLGYLVANNSKIAEQQSSFVQALMTFASFFLLLNTMIPISLMVSLEVAKWFQSTWLEYDVLLWEGEQRSKVLNMLIHEDLGRVDYIFADKTGTLTANEMKFTYCSISGKTYSKEQLLEMAVQPPHTAEGPDEDDPYKKFWLTIGLCHDIVINNKVHEKSDPRMRYQGSSPDEVELVSMAAEVNYVFQEKRAELYTLNVEGKKKDYRILVKIEFSSDRKRMSIIARDLETEKIYLFCKGADSILLKKLRKDTPPDLLDKTNNDLQVFSKEGLRTLVIAYKELDEEIFLDWNDKYYKLQLEQYNTVDEEVHRAALAKLEDEMEQDLILLGVTALEDKLQEGVAETISDLHKAGIKIWMLTGDKLETAENIGYATNLIAQNTKIYRIQTADVEKTKEEYKKIANEIHLIENKTKDFLYKKDEHSFATTNELEQYISSALIIDGEAITYTFNDKDLKSLFINLIPHFRTVICCRSTPNQKAEVVGFVKTNLKKLTLAIGDGGNDVNMIQKADIGVGIFGKEGNQAAFASDYAFVKFFFLWRLLLVHGRWFYIRTSNFINFFFYKNLIFTLPQFWFALYSGFSGQSIYDDSYITSYNSVFTSVAPVYYAAQEQDVNPRENETIRKMLPYVYEEFRDKVRLFSPKRFLFWWSIGLVHSIIVFYITKETFFDAVDIGGRTYDLWYQSLITFAGLFCTVFTVIIIGTNHYHIITFVCYVIFTLFLYFPFGSIMTDQLSSTIDNLMGDILDTPKFWVALLLTLVVCAFILYIPKQYLSFFNPTLADLLRRDRNKRWKKKTRREVYERRNTANLITSWGTFDFNERIMQKSWYNPNTVRNLTTIS